MAYGTRTYNAPRRILQQHRVFLHRDQNHGHLATTRLMLRLISLVAAAAPQPHPTYVALGGSNTAGHNLTRDETRYSKLVYEALQQQQLVDTFQDSALGAMGPIVASSCSSRFVSREARFATVEYLPNLGHGDSGELEAVARLLDELKMRGAKAVLIEIVQLRRDANARGVDSRGRDVNQGGCPIHCVKQRDVTSLHTQLLEIARVRGTPTLTVDANKSFALFQAEDGGVHLNAAGHAFVATELLALFRDWPAPPPPPAARRGRGAQRRGAGIESGADFASAQPSAAADTGVSCFLGDDLDAIVSDTHRFTKTDFASVRAGAAKLGYEAREAGAALTLCVKLPDLASTPGATRSGPYARKPDRGRFAIVVGLQTSHARMLPLYGRAEVTCHGGCTCWCKRRGKKGKPSTKGPCIFDALSQTRYSLTNFMQLEAEPVERLGGAPHDNTTCAECAVRVTSIRGNASEETELPRHRVGVRALIAGVNDWRLMPFTAGKWANNHWTAKLGLQHMRRA